MTRWVRKLAKPVAALGMLGLLGQSLMLGCIGTATASIVPGTVAPAAAFLETGAPAPAVSATAGHDGCGHHLTESRLPPQRDDDCCDWAGLSPFAGGSPVRDICSSDQPELKFAALTADSVAVCRPASADPPQPAASPPPYTRPLYLLDCAFLE